MEKRLQLKMSSYGKKKKQLTPSSKLPVLLVHRDYVHIHFGHV